MIKTNQNAHTWVDDGSDEAVDIARHDFDRALEALRVQLDARRTQLAHAQQSELEAVLRFGSRMVNATAVEFPTESRALAGFLFSLSQHVHRRTP